MDNRQFAILVSITFFVGMVWLVSDIIFNTKASVPVSPKLQTLLESVNPNFNARVIKIINDEVEDKAPPVSVESVNVDTTVINQGTPSGQTTP